METPSKTAAVSPAERQDQQRYTVRFEYADLQHYDSGVVWMTAEQAAKVLAFLEALEKNEHISEPYVGEYKDWETEFEDLLSDLRGEFEPEEQGEAEEPDTMADVRHTFSQLVPPEKEETGVE